MALKNPTYSFCVGSAGEPMEDIKSALQHYAYDHNDDAQSRAYMAFTLDTIRVMVGTKKVQIVSAMAEYCNQLIQDYGKTSDGTRGALFQLVSECAYFMRDISGQMFEHYESDSQQYCQHLVDRWEQRAYGLVNDMFLGDAHTDKADAVAGR